MSRIRTALIVGSVLLSLSPDVLAAVEAQRGVPYVWGGGDVGNPFDLSNIDEYPELMIALVWLLDAFKDSKRRENPDGT